MAIDKLQDKIRKLKNPSVIDFFATEDNIPPHLLEEQGSFCKAYGKFCMELMEGLQDCVPAVRFSFSNFALLGTDGLQLLNFLLNRAQEFGFYVLLDSVEALSRQAAQTAAATLLEWPCDGLVVSGYIGSDALKPYVEKLKESGKDLFVVIRTANKTATELQDLVTGSRLVYTALADTVKRLGEPLVGRCGYSQVAGIGPATSADCLRTLRTKYKEMFLLVEGYDYSNANAKNCSFAFDRLGHGAAVCAGQSVTAAWRQEETDGEEYVLLAAQAAERMKKNLTRYITVL